MDETGFKGKTAIVTGSATGIGAAVARHLGREGANVVVNFATSRSEALATVAAIETAGGRAIAVQGDVAADADCRAIAAAALDAFGGADILINNAGTTKFAAHADLDALNAEDFQRLYAVNVIGAYQMVRALAKPLKESGNGAIVNVSSIAGIRGIGSSVAYAASKGALNTMTLSLARALAPAIRVNAVCPGFVASSWFSRAFGAETAARLAEDHRKTVPLGRVATPEDVAEVVAFFAGSAARHVTGETLLVDGGLHLAGGPTGFR
jgi:3-oxoacyl-[acyl-carrier protein] reductase